MMGWNKVFKFMSIEKARKHLDEVLHIAASLRKVSKLQFVKDDQRSWVTCLNARNEVRKKHKHKITQSLRPKKVRTKIIPTKNPQNTGE